MNVPDLPKPHCILVDGAGRRFVDEAQSYMANGQDFYAHGAVPAHAIMDASYFRKYSWGFRMGAVPKVWHDSGFLKRSEEHTSELQSLMRISYAVFCLKKKNNRPKTIYNIYIDRN